MVVLSGCISQLYDADAVVSNGPIRKTWLLVAGVGANAERGGAKPINILLVKLRLYILLFNVIQSKTCLNNRIEVCRLEFIYWEKNKIL